MDAADAILLAVDLDNLLRASELVTGLGRR
jgi:hypothetical protein